jgi:quercetin dioxygenase-like cupin family protein
MFENGAFLCHFRSLEREKGLGMNRTLLLAAAVLAAASLPTPAQSAHSEMAQATPSPPANSVLTPIVRSGKTIAGQPLRLPAGDTEVVAATVEIPVGGATTIHKHPWSRFVYVERGRVRVVNHDTGETREFSAGQLFPEVVAQWHEGRAVGGSPVKLIVIDLVPRGVNNSVMQGAHQ